MRPGRSLSIECHTIIGSAVTVFPLRPPRVTFWLSLSSSPALIHLDHGSHGICNSYHQCAEEGALSILVGRYVLAVCMGDRVRP